MRRQHSAGGFGMLQLLEENRLILIEAAIVEQLRRSEDITLDPDLVHARLIYTSTGRKRLKALFQAYIDIAASATLPFIMCTPTWRTNRERVLQAKADPGINTDAVRFMTEIRADQPGSGAIIKIGGVIGCKNDCYKAEEGLTASEAERFHSWQIDQLSQAGVDFLIAVTLPNVEEALGIARAMLASGLPYVMSFVIGSDGCILDGTSLADAVRRIDEAVHPRPAGYMVNCAYPTFLNVDRQPKEFVERLIGYQANAASLDHCDLDGATELLVDDIAEWGEEMLRLNRDYGVTILGGCCGTGVEHLRYLVTNWQ
jgi:S-methylmethionine-dependent homocysteine/selenocysteine methylase